ncbi:hypothetical protein KQX54_012996 [Cotesia glomerata]|uniref:Uncharacterized protein n=1 Tax=Cotesia glomerata TaxID=32391 RepID=A0AAV7I327_COTGL|nr:hypothetical protein KQX54_012996 [Cotesia glomerata]
MARIHHSQITTDDKKLLFLRSASRKDLHDSQNRYNIVIEKDIIIHANSFKDGLLTTFLAYYVFGIVYPKEIEGTLEAIQRLFLEICPPKGTKRGGNRKATNVHPKVIKLSTMIELYTTEYTKE